MAVLRVTDSPYPKEQWETIDDFNYESPLLLLRFIDAVTTRAGETDAEYILAASYTVSFRLDGNLRKITVPSGMLTDLASVPWWGRWLVSRVGPHLEASIIHDFLYIAWQDLNGHGARRRDRRFADEVMRVAMKKAEVGLVKRTIIFGAVRAFGWTIYREREHSPRYRELPEDILAGSGHDG